MKKINCSIQINASPTRVWNTLWDDHSYRLWVSAFHEGSYAQSDWQEGGKILFLGSEGNGMSSRIKELKPFERMVFEHLGEVRDGVENFDSPWSGAEEGYTLRAHDGGTELLVEMDSDENFEHYFSNTMPKALEILKRVAEKQKITPFIWFDNNAEAAVDLYLSAFPEARVLGSMRNGDAVMTLHFSLAGQEFTALNGGPLFQINPSVSFYTICETEEEQTALWNKLVEGGKVLMPLDRYPWSEQFGWLQDRFGVNWQITRGKVAEMGQKITPALMFTGSQQGWAEPAMNYYTSSVFRQSHIKLVSRYAAGGPDPEGTINHAQFGIEGRMFIVLDSAAMHGFELNEAVSFVIHCENQREIDYYWEKLTADGGSEGQCGWLKDRFGVSWQVVPDQLGALLGDPDPAKAQRAMQAMLGMKKLDIAALQNA